MPTGLEAALMEEAVCLASDARATRADPAQSLVLRIRGGEVEAFEELMALVDLKVLGLAWRILGDREQARDAAQEVFLRVYRSLDSFRLGESFQAWITRITVNVCFDHLRKRGPTMVSVDSFDADHPVHPVHADLGAEDVVLLDQRRNLLRKALGALSSAERTALVMRDVEGFSTDEVARALGVSPVTIRSQVSTARTKLQRFLARLTHPGRLP